MTNDPGSELEEAEDRIRIDQHYLSSEIPSLALSVSIESRRGTSNIISLSSQFLEIQALRSVPAFWSLKICKPNGVRSECVVSFFTGIMNESAVSLRSDRQPVAEAVASSARMLLV
uniref:Uncharacterized protein n=1 Tax=Ditylenchus dipsaci TaxID=166011 RepID=A0A915DSR3_9BILA